jgi:pimeloyl-ACP methyl ester carboxylesterase
MTLGLRHRRTTLLLGSVAIVGFATSHALEVGLRMAFRTRRRPAVTDAAPSVWLTTTGGKRLAARYVAPRHDDGAVVLVIHGWGGSSADMDVAAHSLSANGLGVLLVDARCHGDSDDDDFASMPRFAEDIEVGLEWLTTFGVTPDRVVLLGHSVGAGAALLVASRRRVAGVIALACMAHPAEMMTAMMVRKRIPLSVVRLVLWKMQRLLGQRFDSFAPVHTIAAVSCPVLLLHGDADTTVPVADAQRLRHASNGGARLVIVEGADHQSADAFLQHADMVVAFVDECLSSRAG